MKYVRAVLFTLLFVCSPALAQYQVPDHHVPIGRGNAAVGFRNVEPGSAGRPLVSNGTTSDPTFQQLPTTGILDNAATNPKLGNGAANTFKGSLNGSGTLDLPLVNCASDGVHASTYTAGVGWACTSLTTPAITPKKSVVTMAVGAPGVVTWNAHGLPDNAVVYFCTTGSLLTGLTACTLGTGALTDTLKNSPTLYYVVPGSQTANTFQVTTAPNGGGIAFSGAQSGTHTAYANVFAATGTIGEYLFVNTEATNGAVTSGVNTQYAQIANLTAGMWEIGGTFGWTALTPTPSFTGVFALVGLGATALTTASPYNSYTSVGVTSKAGSVALGTVVIPVFATANLNAVCQIVFTGGTATCYGDLWARRIR